MKQKGAIELGAVAISAVGLYAAAVLTMFGITFNTNSAQGVQLTEHEGRLSTTETEIRRIDRLEDKIDWLIERQGGNPALIEKAYDVSTTSNQALR